MTGRARSASSEEAGINIVRTYATRTDPSQFCASYDWLLQLYAVFILGWVTRPKVTWVGNFAAHFQGITALLLTRFKRVPFLFEVRDLWPAFAVQVGVLHNPLLISPFRVVGAISLSQC